MQYGQVASTAVAGAREQPVAVSSRVSPAKKETVKNLWLPVPGKTLNDLPDLALLVREHGNNACRPEGEDATTGVLVQVNDTEVALFRFGGRVFGTDAVCPHAGGPLVVGDIEDLAVGDPCIVCPFHKYRFRIRTGKNSFPGQPEFDMETYPVRVKGGGRLFIGFAQLSQKCFEEQDF
eukprot:scpid80031/ scgid5789/ Rieske domain-containing protein